MTSMCALARTLRHGKGLREDPDAITQESEDRADSNAYDIGCDVICEGRFETEDVPGDVEDTRGDGDTDAVDDEEE